MNEARTEKLKKAGWKLGTPKEFLGLTDEEAALIEIKLALARGIKERRLSLRLTQEDVAKQLKSSQSRIAKMEASDATVSMDLLVRSLLVSRGDDSGSRTRHRKEFGSSGCQDLVCQVTPRGKRIATPRVSHTAQRGLASGL